MPLIEASKIVERARFGKRTYEQKHNRKEKREYAVSEYPEGNQFREFFTRAFVHKRARHQQISSALCNQPRYHDNHYQQQRRKVDLHALEFLLLL